MPNTMPRGRELMPRWGQRAVGRRIREAREALGLSPQEFARRLETSATTVYRYESGERNPQPEILRKIAQMTGREPSEFYASADEELAEQLTVNLLAIFDLAMEGVPPHEALAQVSPQSPVTPRERSRLSRRGPLLRQYLDGLARLYYERSWHALSAEERLEIVARIAQEARLPSEPAPEYEQ